MTLNGQNALCRRKDESFGAHCTNLNEDRPILSATKMQANDSSFWKYKVYGDIRGGSSWGCVKWEWGWQRWQFLAHLNGYFFGTFRDKAISIIWQHATPCRPVTDCKINDLERFDLSDLTSKSVFGQHSLEHRCVFWSPLHEFEWR